MAKIAPGASARMTWPVIGEPPSLAPSTQLAVPLFALVEVTVTEATWSGAFKTGLGFGVTGAAPRMKLLLIRMLPNWLCALLIAFRIPLSRIALMT